MLPHAGADTEMQVLPWSLDKSAVLVLPYLLFVSYLQGEKQAEEEESQPVLTQNGSPRPNRADLANQQSPEVYDVRLQRKENEGFGFVILTSKNKPPPGGKCRVLVSLSPPLTVWCSYHGIGVRAALQVALSGRISYFGGLRK